MADEQPLQPNEPESGVKRRVKNPETFRERAIKASTGNDKPKRTAQLRTTSGKVVSPVGRGFTKVFNRQPFIFIGKVLFPSYFRGSVTELKLVSWPGWKLSRQLTFAVLAFAVVFGSTIALVDYGLDKVFKAVLLK